MTSGDTGLTEVSIHAPRMRGDWRGIAITLGLAVSIHAPRMRGDSIS